MTDPHARRVCGADWSGGMSALPVGISYSGGASSRWAIDAILNGEIARPEHVAVFFADTGDEHAWTYDDVAQTQERCRAAGIPFYRGAHREPLFDAVMSATRGERTRVDNPPFWTENQGGSRGQLDQRCTKVFKTAVIRRLQSLWLEEIGKPKKIETWIGFGTDEQHRALKAIKNADVKWQRLGFPAIALGRSRGAQRADVARWKVDGKTPAAPRFSMCRRCPFKSPERWQQTPANDLAQCYETDEAIRHGLEHVSVDEPAFLTDRLIPLRRLIERGDPQPSLPGMESGCDSGMCFL